MAKLATLDNLVYSRILGLIVSRHYELTAKSAGTKFDGEHYTLHELMLATSENARVIVRTLDDLKKELKKTKTEKRQKEIRVSKKEEMYKLTNEYNKFSSKIRYLKALGVIKTSKKSFAPRVGRGRQVELDSPTNIILPKLFKAFLLKLKPETYSKFTLREIFDSFTVAQANYVEVYFSEGVLAAAIEKDNHRASELVQKELEELQRHTWNVEPEGVRVIPQLLVIATKTIDNHFRPWR